MHAKSTASARVLRRSSSKISAERPAVLFVAAEDGTLWTGYEAAPREEEHVVLVAQSPAEPPIQILPRAIRQLATIEESGRRVSRVAMLLNERQDEQSMSTRRLVLLALVKHAWELGSPIQITLCGQKATGADYRRQIADLKSVTQAECEYRSIDACIHIDFEPPPVAPFSTQVALPL